MSKIKNPCSPKNPNKPKQERHGWRVSNRKNKSMTEGSAFSPKSKIHAPEGTKKNP